jgi:serine/threonine protein kinase
LPRVTTGRNLQPVIVAERYEILGSLGTGGEARVFRARDTATDTEIALRLTTHRGEDLPHVSIPATLHPGWVRLFDRGIDAEHGAYATFEMLHGETLGTRVAREPLSSQESCVFVRHALAAVGALHTAGWIHGDLNAENFFWPEGQAWKLLELPFHRLTPPPDSPLFGSIYTLAPEQIDGQPADIHSDLFSLGCLFYYAAAGVYPHAGGSEADIAIGRLRFPATPLREIAPQVSAAFAEGVMQLIARRATERPQDVSAAYALLLPSDGPRHPMR